MIRGVVAVGQRETPTAQLEPPRAARRSAVEIFVWSRALLWVGALLALFTLQPMRNARAGRWDDPSLTHDLGAVTDVWARWDSVHFLRIAEHGYTSTEAAFAPLYPALVAVTGRALFGHYVLAGVLVSLACCLAGFVLLERVAEARLGASGARRTLLYLGLFPTALFLQAVYSESLFLLCCVGAFVLAERGRLWAAGAVCGLAILARPNGAALLPALALLARRDAWRLLLAVPIAALYPLYLWWKVDDAWAFAHAQDVWHRHLSPAGPLGGVWDGLRAGWAGVRQLASGSDAHVYWTAVPAADSAPLRTAVLNLELLAFLTLFCVLAVVAWRRFGAPYGLFAALSLAIPLSVPSSRWPLLSLPRFGLVVFPLFLALAWLGRGPRVHAAVLSASAVLLGVFLTQWALWDWVA
jgi:hypothetical protein